MLQCNFSLLIGVDSTGTVLCVAYIQLSVGTLLSSVMTADRRTQLYGCMVSVGRTWLVGRGHRFAGILRIFILVFATGTAHAHACTADEFIVGD